MLVSSLLGGVAYAIGVAQIMKCQWYSILCIVGVLFVVFLGGNNNEYDKSMQLRIIFNQKFNRNPDEMHEIRQKSIGNPEITVEIEEITLEISFL